MVCKINIFILSTLLLFLTSSAFSENIRVGPISLSLGLEKSVALKLLNDHFYVMPVEGREIYLLSESGPPNIDIVGSVVFEKNHLTSIQRGWGAYEADSSPIDFSKSLYNALVVVVAT